MIAADDARAQDALARCYEELSAAGDRAGQLAAAAAVIEAALVQRRDFSALGLWRTRLEEALASGWPAMPPARELNALFGVAAAAHLEPFVSLPTDSIVCRINDLCAAPPSDALTIDARLAGWALCVSFYGPEGRIADVEATIARVTSLLASGSASPTVHARWLHATGTALTYLTNEERGFDMWRHGREIAETYGLTSILFEICHDELFVRLSRGLSEIDQLFATIERALDRSRVYDVARWYHLKARRELATKLAGSSAREFASTTVELLRLCGYPESQAGMFFVTFAYACARDGDVAAGITAAERVAAATTGEQQRQQQSVAAFLKVYALLCSSAWDALRDPLANAFADAQEHQWFGLRPVPEVAARLCDAALQLNIEPDYVRKVISSRGMVAPGYAGTWPWPTRIRTLGRFEIESNGAPLPLGDRVPRKTLDIIKYLAGKRDMSVSIDKLVSDLWPELDGDTARGTFRTALHRARKLLGDDAALLSSGGRLSLNAARVWVDTSAFEQLVDLIEAALKRGDVAAARHDGDSALALYRGHFLAAEEDAVWQLPSAERLRACFQRLALMLGDHYEQCGEQQQARSVYLRSIEIDPLAENAARQLMVLLRDADERSAALDVYRGLRHRLSVVLGMAPSEQTRRVYESLLQS